MLPDDGFYEWSTREGASPGSAEYRGTACVPGEPPASGLGAPSHSCR